MGEDSWQRLPLFKGVVPQRQKEEEAACTLPHGQSLNKVERSQVTRAGVTQRYDQLGKRLVAHSSVLGHPLQSQQHVPHFPDGQSEVANTRVAQSCRFHYNGPPVGKAHHGGRTPATSSGANLRRLAVSKGGVILVTTAHLIAVGYGVAVRGNLGAYSLYHGVALQRHGLLGEPLGHRFDPEVGQSQEGPGGHVFVQLPRVAVSAQDGKVDELACADAQDAGEHLGAGDLADDVEGISLVREGGPLIRADDGRNSEAVLC